MECATYIVFADSAAPLFSRTPGLTRMVALFTTPATWSEYTSLKEAVFGATESSVAYVNVVRNAFAFVLVITLRSLAAPDEMMASAK